MRLTEENIGDYADTLVFQIEEMLRDIAVLTGGQVISEEVGRKLEGVTVEDLGRRLEHQPPGADRPLLL